MSDDWENELYPSGTKQCTKCRRVLPLWEFQRSWNKAARDGGRPRLNSCCKECKKLEPGQQRDKPTAPAPPKCRRPAAWDRLDVSLASTMGPPFGQLWDHWLGQ